MSLVPAAMSDAINRSIGDPNAAIASRSLAAGPLGEGSEHRRGIVVYRTASMDEARALAQGDPAVKAGRLAVELYSWTVPRGVFR